MTTTTTSEVLTRHANTSDALLDRRWCGLIERMASGEQDALASFYDTSNRLVFGTVLRILGNRAEAEEVTMDVYLQAWRLSATFDARRSRPVSWLTMLARCRAIDRLRSGRARVQCEAPIEVHFDFPACGRNPEEESALSEKRRRIRRALATLSSDQRRLIEMAFFEGLSHSELAAKCGLPLGTVKTRIRSGMLRLRWLLSEGERIHGVTAIKLSLGTRPLSGLRVPLAHSAL